MKISDIKPEVFDMAKRVQARISDRFAEIDAVAEENTRRVMTAFQDNRVSEACFAGTTGYGYDDLGRDTLDKIYAQIFGAEAALVRIGFVNGTHALTAAMFSLVKPGDTILAVTGMPYDTLRSAIGISGDCHGSLKFYGINYAQVDLNAEGNPDIPAIKLAAADKNVTAVMIQRSRGYAERKALTVQEIEEIIKAVKEVNPEANVMVDNCYGEFTDIIEPTHVGADIIAGSLIKNPGGGIAPTGGYIAGRSDLVEKCGHRYSAPGTGREIGCTLETLREMFLGLYSAPGTVCEALKTAVYAQCLLGLLDKSPVPRYNEPHNDIVTCFEAGSAEALVGFCQGIQALSPVDSYVAPEPSHEPGYTDEVIMASGSFTTGSTIELSCDGPMRAPYMCYLQGGLNFTASRAGVLMAAQKAWLQ